MLLTQYVLLPPPPSSCPPLLISPPFPVAIYNVDPDDPFPPLPSSHWLLDLTTQMSALDLLLDQIPDVLEANKHLNVYPLSPNMMTTVKSTGKYATSTGLGVMPLDPSRQILSLACPTAVLKCVQLSLKEIGGRVMLLTDSNPDRGNEHSTVPSIPLPDLICHTGFGKIKRRPTPESYGGPEEFSYYGALEAVVAASKNQSLSLRNLIISDKTNSGSSSSNGQRNGQGNSKSSGSSSSSSSSLSESEMRILEEYIELGKRCHEQNTTVDIFYFVPSLNTIVENDLERWGYVDPHQHSASSTGASQQRPSSLTPPPPPPPTSGVYRSLSSTSSMPSPQRLRTKLSVNTSSLHHEQQQHQPYLARGGSSPNIPPMSPRRPDVLKCSNDNSAIYAEVTRVTGGNLHLFFGSLHLEDNVHRLKSVSPSSP
jgi:hypothetical protein